MKARFNSAKRDGRGWWSQICSLSRERLFYLDDMGRDFPNVRETLTPFVTSTNVKVVTIDELLDTVRLPEIGTSRLPTLSWRIHFSFSVSRHFSFTQRADTLAKDSMCAPRAFLAFQRLA